MITIDSSYNENNNEKATAPDRYQPSSPYRTDKYGSAPAKDI